MDRYARLRDDLRVFRAMTAQSQASWCRECEMHLADESGLCPVCAPAPGSVDAA